MIITVSTEPLKKAYFALFESAKLPADMQAALADGLTEDACAILSAQQQETLSSTVFGLQAINNLSSVLFSYPEYVGHLSNFLTTFLSVKQYDAIFLFFNKAFVSRIGSNPFVSRNAKNFDMAERTFDRFIEAVRTCGVLENNWLPLVFSVLDADQAAPRAKWKRPAYDYLIGTAHSNEREFLKFITANFALVGLSAFKFAIEAGIEGVLDSLVASYLADDKFKTHEAWTLLRKYPKPVVAHLLEKLTQNEGDRKSIIDMLVGFKMEEGVAQKLAEIYGKEKSPIIRRIIIEHIDIPILSNIKQEHQLVGMANKLGHNPIESFLGLTFDCFPMLTLESGKEAPLYMGALLLSNYKNLASSRAYAENSYFSQFINQASLNEFCKFTFDRVLDGGFLAENEWAMLMVVQNTSVTMLKNLLTEVCNFYDESLSDGFAVFVSLIALVRKNDVCEVASVFDAFAKHTNAFRAVLLRAVANCGKYSTIEVEELKDKFTPEFKLNENLGCEYKLLNGVAELRIKDDTTVEIIYPAGVSEADLDSNTKFELNQLQQAMRAELIKQLNRLYSAYETGKKWSVEGFREAINNHLFNSLAERLLWGKYKNDKLIAIFKVSGAKLQDVVEREKTFDTDYTIGVLHPIEYESSEYLTNNVKQPPAFNQLVREVFYKEAYKPQGSAVLKFNGLFVFADSFVGRILENGWVAGLRSRHGSIISFLRYNYELGVVAEIACSPMSEKPQNESATLGELRFYKIADMSDAGQAERAHSLSLHAVPDRFFSNILYELVIASRK